MKMLDGYDTTLSLERFSGCMLERLLKKVRIFSKKKPQPEKAASLPASSRIIPRSEHSISRNEISEFALKVLYRLKKHGYEAYLVGGGVRDLLLGLHPKDFDVSTNASPEQIRQVFNNCRLIGRRFRLAHVYFGRHIVEVATFRGPGTADVSEVSQVSEHGLLVRDNIYGTLEEDVWRRDFTVNALYYNISDFSVVDFTGGIDDLNNKTIKLIGDPEVRFREDPVRILRALRFACKLNFKLAPNLLQPIREFGSLLSHISSARLYEETLKMFHSGHAVASFRALQEHQVLPILFPDLSLELLNTASCRVFVEQVLNSTDVRVKEGKPLNPAFIFSAFMWYPLQTAMNTILEQEKMGVFPAMVQASEQVFNELRKTICLPKRFALIVKEIWFMQVRLEKRQSRKAEQLTQDQRFRAAYDFLLLRATVEPSVKETAQWWMQWVDGDDVSRQQLEDAEPKHRKKRRKKKRTNSPSKDVE